MSIGRQGLRSVLNVKILECLFSIRKYFTELNIRYTLFLLRENIADLSMTDCAITYVLLGYVKHKFRNFKQIIGRLFER